MHYVHCGQTSSHVVGAKILTNSVYFIVATFWVPFGVAGLCYILDYRIDTLVTTYPPSVSPENHVIPPPHPPLYSPLNWLIIVHLITERYMYRKILILILNTVSLFKTVVFCFLVLSIKKFKKITQRIRFMLFLWLYSFHRIRILTMNWSTLYHSFPQCIQMESAFQDILEEQILCWAVYERTPPRNAMQS